MPVAGGYGCRRASVTNALRQPADLRAHRMLGVDGIAGTSIGRMTQGTNMKTSYVTRDNFGMYANKNEGPGPALMGANTLLGNDVYNQDGQDLGDIKEFMIDMASGKIAYAVLSFGGLLGMGEKLFAVPWAALTLDTVKERFTLNKFYGTPYSAD
jgi:sporulation protein YlmC with PRC-barrel domain